MRTLVLSGWTQPVDALSHALDGEIIHFDYSDYPSPEASFAGLKALSAIDNVVGWSMGGQLAVRAIEAGALRPRHLTLVAVPWQFVAPFGMGAKTFELFRESYMRDPARLKERFGGLIAKGDKHARQILEEMRHHPEVGNTQRWLPWLDELGTYSLDGADLSLLPSTLLIHGEQDAITPHAQALRFAHLPQVTLSSWGEAGHAPHLHDPQRLWREIAAHRARSRAAA
jgi:pimeloyl-ACP methyl ester carboxylesterase